MCKWSCFKFMWLGNSKWLLAAVAKNSGKTWKWQFSRTSDEFRPILCHISPGMKSLQFFHKLTLQNGSLWNRQYLMNDSMDFAKIRHTDALIDFLIWTKLVRHSILLNSCFIKDMIWPLIRIILWRLSQLSFTLLHSERPKLCVW